MERIHRNCRELKKTYKTEDVNSPKAASFRKKIFGLLRAAELTEADGCEKGVELFWRTGYYEPIQDMKKRMFTDFMNHMIQIFEGEIMAFLMMPSRNVARYYIMLGDLMRYSQSSLATLEYRKAVEANPDIGKPFNQLALQQKGIRAVRFFLLSLAAKESFKNAPENLKKSLTDNGTETSPPILQHAMNIVQYMIFDIKRREIIVEFNKLTDIIETEGEDDYVQENLPMIVQSLVVAHYILPSRLPDDYFLAPIQLLADLFTLLLKKKKPAAVSKESLVPGRRRRQRSSASSSEEEAEDEPSEKDDEIPELWTLSTCCQWLVQTQTHLAAIDKKTHVIPASVPETLNILADRLIDRLNDVSRVLPMKNEECSAEEADWLLNGPALNRGENGLEAAQAQLSYWTDILTTTTETDVEFSDYFRRRKVVDPSKLRKKIGLLHVDRAIIHQAKKTEDSNWLPIYVILDYPVLERHLQAVRTIIGGGKTAVIPIVPLFVLGELDRMKSTGPGIRDAMRFIEKKQSGGQLRVVKGSSHMEIARELAITADHRAGKIGSDLVAILTTHENVGKYTDLVTYNIKSFMERWKRTNS